LVGLDRKEEKREREMGLDERENTRVKAREDLVNGDK